MGLLAGAALLAMSAPADAAIVIEATNRGEFQYSESSNS
jgi:hypothetical protein